MKSLVENDQIPLPIPRTDGERSRTAWERFFLRVDELKSRKRKRSKPERVKGEGS